jgi:hypothetical protein
VTAAPTDSRRSARGLGLLVVGHLARCWTSLRSLSDLTCVCALAVYRACSPAHMSQRGARLACPLQLMRRFATRSLPALTCRDPRTSRVDRFTDIRAYRASVGGANAPLHSAGCTCGPPAPLAAPRYALRAHFRGNPSRTCSRRHTPVHARNGSALGAASAGGEPAGPPPTGALSHEPLQVVSKELLQ